MVSSMHNRDGDILSKPSDDKAGTRLSFTKRSNSQQRESQTYVKVVKKEPYQIDYLNRANKDYEVSEISDSDLPIGYDAAFQPKEVIFAELNAGSYFGELSLRTHNKKRAHLRDVRMGRCFTSVWATQNTHLFYLEDKDYQNILFDQQRRKLEEIQAEMKKIPIFKHLNFRQRKNIAAKFQMEVKQRGSKLIQ